MPIAAATKQRIFAVLTVTTLAGPAASAADTPAYMEADRRAASTSSAGGHGDEERPRFKRCHVRALRRRRPRLPEEHPGAAPRHPRPIFRGRRPVHPVPAGNEPARSALSTNCLSAIEIRRAQCHGAKRGRRAIFGQHRRTSPGEGRCWPIAARCRRPSIRWMATDMPADWRVNSRRLLQNNVAFMDACTEKGAISTADLQSFARQQAPFLKKNIAWAARDPGRPLDGRDRRVEEAARRRLGQGIRGQQHDLRRAPEQCAVQCARPVFWLPTPSTAG